jgi:hypothetical protein
VTALFAVLLLAAAMGQEPPEPLPALPLPAGGDAWAVRVETTGGFTGRGTGSLSATSAGDVFCVLTVRCPRRLIPAAHRAMSQLVRAIPLVAPAPRSSSSTTLSTCSDCVTTTMTVQRRDEDGEHTLRYTWDVSTAHAVPEEALRLRAAILGLTTP